MQLQFCIEFWGESQAQMEYFELERILCHPLHHVPDKWESTLRPGLLPLLGEYSPGIGGVSRGVRRMLPVIPGVQGPGVVHDYWNPLPADY